MLSNSFSLCREVSVSTKDSQALFVAAPLPLFELSTEVFDCLPQHRVLPFQFLIHMVKEQILVFLN